jgi:hypothetical protein
VRDCGELRAVACGVVVELEKRDGEEFHVFWDAEDFCGDFLVSFSRIKLGERERRVKRAQKNGMRDDWEKRWNTYSVLAAE